MDLLSIVMKLKEYRPEQILRTEIVWCEPWIFEIDEEGKAKVAKGTSVASLEICICSWVFSIWAKPKCKKNECRI